MPAKLKAKKINLIYERLLATYGPQGWWPLNHSIAKDYLERFPTGYHPGCFDYPKTESERFEIILGAVLTQNTNWQNVKLALANLSQAEAISPQRLSKLNHERLSELIRPSGYFRIKAGYLKNLADFLLRIGFETLEHGPLVQVRKQLLEVKGVGEETADSILLYAFGRETFVIDAYTKRLLVHHGLAHEKENYQSLKHRMEKALPLDVQLYQEYHALIVRHAKQHYSKKPYGQTDSLLTSLD